MEVNDVFAQPFEEQNMSENKVYLRELSYHTTLSLALMELFIEQYFPKYDNLFLFYSS